MLIIVIIRVHVFIHLFKYVFCNNTCCLSWLLINLVAWGNWSHFLNMKKFLIRATLFWIISQKWPENSTSVPYFSLTCILTETIIILSPTIKSIAPWLLIYSNQGIILYRSTYSCPATSTCIYTSQLKTSLAISLS